MHIPVLLKETIDGLEIKKGDTVLDATVGGGGHSAEICKRFGGSVRIVGIDADEGTLRKASERLEKCNVVLQKGNFRNLDAILKEAEIEEVERILFDLGISSYQLQSSGRGFSFQRTEPLMMTFTERPGMSEVTARDVVNEWSEENLEKILEGFSDERYAKKIARGIAERRKEKPIETTTELVEIIKKATPPRYHKQKIHFATKTFQAIRMAANDELGALEEGLRKGFEHLAGGGRIAVISFHSVEDRTVKNFFKKIKEDGAGKIITRKPTVPTGSEIKKNPRAKSAKLRILQKIEK